MPEDNIKIRVKAGESEAEIEAPLSSIRDAIELIPDLLAKLPKAGAWVKNQGPASLGETATVRPAEQASVSAHDVSTSTIPMVTVEKGDSLSDVISKFFSDSWGRSPRKLMEVRDALQSYGLNYPKQSVAVALLRLAKGSKLRRFKGEGGEYVYTASTGATRISAPVLPAPSTPHSDEESAPEFETEEHQESESQLDLDAPAAN